MLTTDAPLSDIALRCGFSDQAHLCKHFRQAAGQTPAAWRRARRALHEEHETPPVEHLATASHNGMPLRLGGPLMESLRSSSKTAGDSVRVSRLCGH